MKGSGNLGAREREGRARKEGKEPLFPSFLPPRAHEYPLRSLLSTAPTQAKPSWLVLISPLDAIDLETTYRDVYETDDTSERREDTVVSVSSSTMV